ncbi:hypothetical protein ACLPJG_27235 [Pseudomonas aeruginosa]|jgi:hypothetical protein|uniref:Uncharacterized protein n=2 Tax=Pseudomonas TaxID=286 RepID=A0A3M4JW09_9PSED|nr:MULTISPECIES: hypothetical protein [Pseudomonas]MCT8191173.1 hypothetical protein [Pseudomonas monteilii]RFQ05754.1 hypothetical protein D0O09_03050 [Pseudomonas putida]MDM3950999.1 hypothetical protein [Pseudomonas alloputida]RMQ20913.1 hypothetical protein ALQ08_200207 [Pseudomonas syringae pv. delphinii]UPL41672.1 hypothetical protein MX621_30830 [Pseudomonas aeruginosa]
MQKHELDAVDGVDRSSVYRVLGAMCLAVGFFCIGPMVIDHEFARSALDMSSGRAAVLMLSAAGVVFFLRGMAGLAVLLLGFLVAGAVCEQYYALDAATTMGAIGFPFLMLGIGLFIFNPSH